MGGGRPPPTDRCSRRGRTPRRPFGLRGDPPPPAAERRSVDGGLGERGHRVRQIDAGARPVGHGPSPVGDGPFPVGRGLIPIGRGGRSVCNVTMLEAQRTKPTEEGGVPRTGASTADLKGRRAPFWLEPRNRTDSAPSCPCSVQPVRAAQTPVVPTIRESTVGTRDSGSFRIRRAHRVASSIERPLPFCFPPSAPFPRDKWKPAFSCRMRCTFHRSRSWPLKVNSADGCLGC